jgi:hypothetical protein
MVCARRSRSLLWLLAAAITAVLAALPATADDPPQPAPPSPTPTPVPGSLAAAAAGIRLQAVGEGEPGSLVITNQNLKAVGAGASGRLLCGPSILDPEQARRGVDKFFQGRHRKLRWFRATSWTGRSQTS